MTAVVVDNVNKTIDKNLQLNQILLEYILHENAISVFHLLILGLV